MWWALVCHLYKVYCLPSGRACRAIFLRVSFVVLANVLRKSVAFLKLCLVRYFAYSYEGKFNL